MTMNDLNLIVLLFFFSKFDESEWAEEAQF